MTLRRIGSRKWILVAGARPNFMKVAPLIRAIDEHNSSCHSSLVTIHYLLVHTGQHYDFNMSDAFFMDLNLPKPDVHLGVGSGNHGEQTGRVLIEFEKVLLKEKPDLVIVVGDVNSTMAAALAAAKLHIPVAHVEAGLRSFDRKMPEEINRLVTDAVSDYLFTPSPEGDENLLKEGIPKEKIFLVGDIMVDSLMFHLGQAKKSTILHRLGLTDSRPIDHPDHPDRIDQTDQTDQIDQITPYALLTLHRPSNVDDPVTFGQILKGLQQVATRVPVLFPIHPRTKKQIAAFGMEDAFTFHNSQDIAKIPPPLVGEGEGEGGKIHCFDPLGYLDFLNLMAHAAVVLTDSGGIQEETTVLNTPCITLRDTTERPITLTEGTNVLVHNNPEKIVSEVTKVLDGNRRESRCPSLWDGNTAERIVAILSSRSIVLQGGW